MVYEVIKKGGIAVLIDPDSTPVEDANRIIEKAKGVAGIILVGGSTLWNAEFDEYMRELKEASSIPLVIFPGYSLQVSRHADAILFLSLLSGRNPQFLIGEQVRAAPLIKRVNLEAIPTAYLLIDGGKITSAEFMSNTKPIPRDKPDIAVAHAITAELMGMKCVYMDAGSGAFYPVPDEMIEEVKKNISLPLFVGGGLKTPQDVERKRKCGADWVVIGTAIEEDEDFLLALRDIV
ncbi:geranylgeranylglyceryl/heptaprenylglyceryl phosphate synthase [bacterium]|nr:MAG: geranylgeranylglyceryl/heptaprenylglyceryl phosphate synthase [bacterium]